MGRVEATLEPLEIAGHPVGSREEDVGTGEVALTQATTQGPRSDRVLPTVNSAIAINDQESTNLQSTQR